MSTETRMSPSKVEEAPAKVLPKRSAVETIKEKSRQLRGSIAEELQGDSDHFNEQDKQLIKFHGSYQQEDRDARKARRKEGVGKHYMFMVRCKIPGGKLTAQQYLALDELAGTYANGTLRFTTRQGIQLHGVLKDDLKRTIAGINHCLLSTLGACGDVERNVMACPAPHLHDSVHEQLQETAATLAALLAPRSRAYHEIWLNGQPVGDRQSEADVEPLYGKLYLPRKFKTGLALPEDNCVDIYAQDLGLLAIVEDGKVVGYNVLVGGGMGMTHGNPNTFPHLAKPICYVPASAVTGAVEAVVRLFRDHGNRADRKRARIKYVVHDWGVDKFRRVLADYIGGALHEPRPVEVHGFEPHHGWHPQGDGKWYYGLSVENGRVKDEGKLRLRSALKTLIERFQPELRLTPLQDILVCGLDGSARADLERTLAECGVLRPDQLSTIRKLSLACPAIPTCGLALCESERALPGIIDQLETELRRLGLEEEKLSVRMTGCPNGCARPYQSDIGIVGRSGDKYTLFVGGHMLGHRLNFALKDLVPQAEILPTLLPLLEHFKGERQPRESFGDYCHRLGVEKLQAMLPREETQAKGRESLTPAKTTNGEAHAPGLVGRSSKDVAALAQPDVQTVSLRLPEPAVTAKSLESGTCKQSETFLAGPVGKELPDYMYRYNSDGGVRETVVYFYAGDQRAGAASAGTHLFREAIYPGSVNPVRLHSAPKSSDTFYVGRTGHERRDFRLEYHSDGSVHQTIAFLYENDARASVAPSGSAIRRQVAYEGRLS